MTFPEMVKKEIDRSIELHGNNIHNLHEALGIIREEYMEFEAEVFKKKPWAEDVLKELVQISAMCQKVAENLGLLEEVKNISKASCLLTEEESRRI